MEKADLALERDFFSECMYFRQVIAEGPDHVFVHVKLCSGVWEIGAFSEKGTKEVDWIGHAELHARTAS